MPAARNWVSCLVTYYDWHPGGIGHWHLSEEAGGGKVHLTEGYVEHHDRIKVKNKAHGLSTAMAWFNRHDIRNHLYDYKDMPWGQAKMSLYCLHDLRKGEHRANGEPLKDDLGELNGMVWNRPS